MTEKDGAVVFAVKAVPRASRTEFAGEHDGAVRVRIASPPVEGAANDELIRFLAKSFGVSRSAVTVVSGQHGRNKLVRVEGVAAGKVAETVDGRVG